MKSFFTLAVALFLGTTLSQAQSLKLIDLNGNDVTNGVFSDVVDTSSLDPYEFDVDVINLSSNALSIGCSRVFNQFPGQSESYFCWDVCYLPMVNVAFSPLSVNANDTISGYFHSYFRPNYEVGTATTRYKFVNTANANDTATITVILYSGTLGIKNANLDAASSKINAYPNPASSFVSLKYDVAASKQAAVVITNELGQTVYEKSNLIGLGSIRLETADFTPGIYFYSLFEGSARVATKKLVITQ